MLLRGVILLAVYVFVAVCARAASVTRQGPVISCSLLMNSITATRTQGEFIAESESVRSLSNLLVRAALQLEAFASQADGMVPTILSQSFETFSLVRKL